MDDEREGAALVDEVEGDDSDMKILYSRKGDMKLLRTENMCSMKHLYRSGCCGHQPEDDCHIQEVKETEEKEAPT